jgi:hypothetical protein
METVIRNQFPGINLFVATCLPIRFLETAHMSQYVKASGKVKGKVVPVIK